MSRYGHEPDAKETRLNNCGVYYFSYFIAPVSFLLTLARLVTDFFGICVRDEMMCCRSHSGEISLSLVNHIQLAVHDCFLPAGFSSSGHFSS